MSRGRQRPCDRAAARARLRHAQAYLDVADLVASDGSLPQEYDGNHVAAGVAVLAAIAASDALCCALLGQRSRDQDHRQAISLLGTVRFGAGSVADQARRATELSAALATALDLKDEAHYGTQLLGTEQVRRLLRASRKLTEAAADVVHDARP